MKNFKILTVATFSLMLLSGCSNNLPKESVPMAEGPLSTSTSSSSPSNSSSPTEPAATAPSVPDTKPTVNSDPSQADPTTFTPPPEPPKRDTNKSTILPGVVDNPDQRNQKLVPDPARDAASAMTGVGGSGAMIDGARDSVGAGNKDDKQQAAESYISFVNLINDKDYAGACEYVKLAPAQGNDCLAAMEKVDIATRTYPVGLKIDRLDNGVVKGDTATLSKLVFVYDGDKRLRDVTMFRPADGSGKWKTAL